MPRATGPLFSINARQSVGDLTAQKARRQPYTRKKPVPANPRSATQTANRLIQAYLMHSWRHAHTYIHQTWADITKGKPQSPMNGFLSHMIPQLIANASNHNCRFTKPMPSTLPPSTLGVVRLPGQLEYQVDPPTPPPGWTLLSIVAANWLWSYAPDWPSRNLHAGIDTTPPYKVIMSRDPTYGPYTDYWCCAWCCWRAPDGSIRYSGSTMTWG